MKAFEFFAEKEQGHAAGENRDQVNEQTGAIGADLFNAAIPAEVGGKGGKQGNI